MFQFSLSHPQSNLLVDSQNASSAAREFILILDGVSSSRFNQFVETFRIFRIFDSPINGRGFGIVTSIMGCNMERGQIGIHLLCDPPSADFLMENSHQMDDLNPSSIMDAQPLGEVFIDPFPEPFILLNLVVSFCQGATASTAEGTDGKASLLGNGQIAGCHQEIGISVDRLDGIPATGKFGNVGELQAQSLRHLPGGDLVIQGSHRHGASQVEGILRKRRVLLWSLLHNESPVFSKIFLKSSIFP
jgi:hypothetical protein